MMTRRSTVKHRPVRSVGRPKKTAGEMSANGGHSKPVSAGSTNSRAYIEQRLEKDFPEIWRLRPRAYFGHLDTSQRAMAAARLRHIYETMATARQIAAGGDRSSKEAKAAAASKALPVNLPEALKGDSRDQAGAALNVSGKTVEAAAAVIADAIPEITAAVECAAAALFRSAAGGTHVSRPGRERWLVEVGGRRWDTSFCVG